LKLTTVLADASFVISQLRLVVEVMGDWCDQVERSVKNQKGASSLLNLLVLVTLLLSHLGEVC
jgi:hypothetical protein